MSQLPRGAKRHLPMVFLALLLSTSTSQALEQRLTAGTILNPYGAGIRYDLKLPVGAGFRIGFIDEFLFYSNGVGTQLSWQTAPRWFGIHVEGLIEPGYFLKVSPTIGRRKALQRTFDYRLALRAQTELNFKTSSMWFYSRSTLTYRHRGFREDDTFRGLVINEERAAEQATSLMGKISQWDGGGKLWIYAEYTVGYLRGLGVYPNRPSAGLIAERWPSTNITLNLDVFYSLANSPLDGFGGLLIAWINW